MAKAAPLSSRMKSAGQQRAVQELKNKNGLGGTDFKTTSDEKLANTVILLVLRTMVETGYVSSSFVEKASREQLGRKIRSFVKNAEIDFVIDYRNSIQKRAKQFLRNGNKLDAVLYYATYFEHELNRLVHDLCRRRKLSESARKNMIKLSWEAKATWVLEVLKAPPFSTDDLKKLKKVFDARNSYVHYKWDVTEDQRQVEIDIALESVETVLKSFTSTRSAVIYESMTLEKLIKTKNKVAARPRKH